MAETQVVITRCPDYHDEDRVRDAVYSSLNAIHGVDSLIRPGQRVLLKPNFLVRALAATATTTHPSVIKAAVEWVQDRDAVPFIGDSPAFGSAKSVVAGLGLTRWLKNHEVEVVNLGRSRTVYIRIGEGGHAERFHLTVSGHVLDADAIINLAKIKAHAQLRMTLGVKNLYGCVAGKRKPIRHTCSRGDLAWFARMLLANMLAIKPAITLADGIVAMERLGPRGGDARALGLLFAGTDPIAVDRVIVEVLNVAPTRIPTLEQAIATGVGVTDLNKIAIVGERIEDVRIEHFELPDKLYPIEFSIPRLVRSFWKSLKAAVLPG